MGAKALRVAKVGFLVVVAACSAPSPAPGTSEVASTDARDTVAAALPGHRFELRARASEDPDGTSWLMPPATLFKNTTPSLNHKGEIAFSLRTLDGQHQVWKEGRIIHAAADRSAIISRASINESGDVAFDVMEAATRNGIWLFRVATGQAAFRTSEPLGADGWINVRLADDGRIGMRAGAGGYHYLGWFGPSGFARLADEEGTNPDSPYTFLFTPAFDNEGRAAAKVALTTGGHEIRVFSRDGGVRTIARDRNRDPDSPFVSIDNGVAIADGGAVAFIANVGGKRGVFRTDGRQATQMALEGEGGVAEIGWFTPAINAAGLVVFKGEDDRGHNSVWISSGDALKKLVSVGDTLPSDEGPAFPLPETELDPHNRIAFGGGVAVNNRGDVAFLTSLAQKTPDGGTKALGTALYLALAEAPGAPSPGGSSSSSR